MIMRFLLLGMLFLTVTSAGADERFYLRFDLIQDALVIERGNAIVSRKPHTWSKGLRRSYLKLRCNRLESGKTEKLYSTVDHFAGLSVTHQLVGGNIELTVVRNIVQPRTIEIRALGKSECRDLSPVVTSTTQTYHFPAEGNIHEPRPFGENMTFRVTLESK